MQLRPIFACAALVLSLAACDQIKPLLPQGKAPPVDTADRLAVDFAKRAAVETAQIKLHPDIVRREGGLLTIYNDGKPVASFQSHMEDCAPAWPVCEGWTYLDALELKNPNTGKIEAYPRVTWSYGKITGSGYIPTASFVVDHQGRLHHVGDSQPVYSSSHSFVATQEPFLSEGIVILDSTDASLRSYFLPTLLTADSWMDDSHLAASVVADQGIVLATISRKSNGGWEIRETDLYPDAGDRETAMKSGAKHETLNNPPQVIDGWDDAFGARAGPHGYIQLFSYSATVPKDGASESAADSASVNPR